LARSAARAYAPHKSNAPRKSAILAMSATHQWLILLFGAVTLYGVVILLSAFLDWLLFRTINRKKDTDKNEAAN
jgi:cytochrome b561